MPPATQALSGTGYLPDILKKIARVQRITAGYMKRLGVAVTSGNSVVYTTNRCHGTLAKQAEPTAQTLITCGLAIYVTTRIQFAATIRETRNTRIEVGQ